MATVSLSFRWNERTAHVYRYIILSGTWISGKQQQREFCTTIGHQILSIDGYCPKQHNMSAKQQSNIDYIVRTTIGHHELPIDNYHNAQ